jgi:hypothetical protein
VTTSAKSLWRTNSVPEQSEGSRFYQQSEILRCSE